MGVDVSMLWEQNGRDLRAALQPGQTLTVDNRHVVPGGVSDAVVVNIPQRMLFLFSPGDEMRGYPVAVGRPTWQTPTGSFSVSRGASRRVPEARRSAADDSADCGAVPHSRT